MVNNNKNVKPKKALFQGSIRAEDRDCFHTSITTKIATWDWPLNPDLHGTFSERCLTTKLKKLFETLGVNNHVEDNSELGSAMVEKLPGVRECSIEQDGKAHIRIRFGGLTRSGFEYNRKAVQAFLDKENIPSEDYCLYVCVTGAKQHELSDKYLAEMEKLKKLE